MANDTELWAMIHAERTALTDFLETLTPRQWATTSLCGQWSVHVAAAHVLAGAEQTPARFARRMAANAFRFNTMIDRDAHRFGELPSAEIVARLRTRTKTTNRPPAPVAAMLGEVVVHGADIREPLGAPDTTAAAAAITCLEMFKRASFPVGGRARVRGLRLVASDVEWASGDGPEVTGPATSLLLAITGRAAGIGGLSGAGVGLLGERMPAAMQG
jgi:uncharacterized protein (TIGR03083 family)